LARLARLERATSCLEGGCRNTEKTPKNKAFWFKPLG